MDRTKRMGGAERTGNGEKETPMTTSRQLVRMRHSEILPEQNCDGELIELPEDQPTYTYVAQCARCGTEFTYMPDCAWVTVVYPGMRTP